MQHRILLAAALLYLAGSHLIWVARDTRPAFWDMALHQTGALRILNAFAENGPAALAQVPSLTGFYPPLYHAIVAVFYALFGVSTDAARWANIPATALLVGGTYLIGRRLMPPAAAALAGVLAGFYPLMVWISREPLVDYWLAALVTLAFWALVASDGFRDRRMTLLFGVLAGLGMLTKWTFVVFLAGPALWTAGGRWKQALPAAAVAAAIAAYWYAPQIGVLPELLRLNAAGGVSEGDPAPLTWAAAVFYVRALAGYQLFLPLFVLSLAGLVHLVRNFDARWTPVLLWIGGAWACLMLLQNKDPRYTVPLLPAVALISAAGIGARPLRIAALLPLLVFQHYLISFGVRALPDKVVIARGVEGPLSWDWNLYTQRYFDLWGPPAGEDWPIDGVLDRVGMRAGGTPVRLGLVPDIPRFDANAFEFQILARDAPVRIRRLVVLEPEALRNNDYILLSERAQGFPGLVPEAAEGISAYVRDHPDEYEALERFPLPNGEIIRLYRVRAPVETG